MGKIKWQLLITREVCLLERYWRVLGYKDRLLPVTKIGVKNLLGVGRNGLMEVYDDPVDRARRFKLMREEFRHPKMREMRECYFQQIINSLRKSRKRLLKKKNYSSLKNFIKFYKYGRSIVWYTFELGKLMKKGSLFKWAGDWHHFGEIETCRAWDRTKPFFRYVARKTGVPLNDLFFYTLPEFISLFKNEKKVKKKIIEIRKEEYVLLCLNAQVIVLIGKKCRDYINKNLPKIKIAEKGQIKGVCGYKGRISGKVRIVNTTAQSYQLKKGEVLVSTMTAPRLSRAFKQAAAFVTDEGGITSHAAIVARELKIPCVIGTKIATQVLKDGDLVEVEANKGVVRKL